MAVEVKFKHAFRGHVPESTATVDDKLAELLYKSGFIYGDNIPKELKEEEE